MKASTPSTTPACAISPHRPRCLHDGAEPSYRDAERNCTLSVPSPALWPACLVRGLGGWLRGNAGLNRRGQWEIVINTITIARSVNGQPSVACVALIAVCIPSIVAAQDHARPHPSSEKAPDQRTRANDMRLEATLEGTLRPDRARANDRRAPEKAYASSFRYLVA